MKILDTNVSIVEGSIGAIPRRIVVHEEDAERAREILEKAGLKDEIETMK